MPLAGATGDFVEAESVCGPQTSRGALVKDVQCIGVPDAKYGEELCACIILRDGEQATEQDIRDFCTGRIARYKIPRYVRFMTSFPMTVTGKVAKYLLREQISRELGVNEGEAA